MKERTKLQTSQEVLEGQLNDPAFRQRWEQSALARAVAIRILAYRAERGMSQTQLAKVLGMKQPTIARLEAGEHTPSLETLIHLSQALGLAFLVNIAPAGRPQTWVTEEAKRAEVIEQLTIDGSQILVAAD